MRTILLASILIACGDKEADTAVEETEAVDTAEQALRTLALRKAKSPQSRNPTKAICRTKKYNPHTKNLQRKSSHKLFLFFIHS